MKWLRSLVQFTVSVVSVFAFASPAEPPPADSPADLANGRRGPSLLGSSMMRRTILYPHTRRKRALLSAGLATLALTALALSGDRESSQEEAQSLDVPALVAWFKVQQERVLPIAPPTQDFLLQQGFPEALPIDSRSLPRRMLKQMPGEVEFDCPVYPIYLVEDADTRATVIFNAYDEPVYSIPPTPDHDPYVWVEAKYPELKAGILPATEADALRALYDPARIQVAVKLVPAEFYGNYMAAAQSSSTAFSITEADAEMQPRGAGGPFVITDIAWVVYGLELTFPADDTCYYTIESCADLASGSWSPVDILIGAAPAMSWSSAGNPAAYTFFRVREIPRSSPEDQDQDGLNDVEELTEYQTGALNADSDGDGLPDGWEVQNGYSPTAPNLVIDLPPAEVAIQTKAMIATGVFDPLDGPCFSSLDGLYWDQVLAHDWPAKGSFTIDCSTLQSTWNLLPTQSSAEYAYRSTASDSIQLQRILYRYFPTAPTQNGEVYRLTVLERFQHPSPSTIVSTHRIRTLLLSGDGTNEHYFEPASGFDIDGQGDLISEPDEEGYIIPTVIRVDLDIDGVDDADEETTGAVVVRRHDNNDAPRKKIILRQVEPTAWLGDVLLSRGNTKVKVFDAETGGTEITFNGTDNKFASTALPKSLWVQGDTASAAMRDVLLDLSLDGLSSCKDSVNLTVLWVDVEKRTTGNVSDDNAGKAEYIARRGDDGFGFAIYSLAIGLGVEFVGTVHPSDFDQDTVFRRKFIASKEYSNRTLRSSDLDERIDTSDAELRDDDPQSGDSEGTVYDLDSPGVLILAENPGDTDSRRVNFKQWTTYTVGESDVRCSQERPWYLRINSRMTPDYTFELFDEVEGDNQIDFGLTSLEYNLE